MPACERSRQLSAYHDGELAAEERVELEAHIGQCASCARELERLRRLSGFLATASIPEMRTGFMDRLHSGVRSARDVVVVQMAVRLMAVAAAVLVVCVLCLWQLNGAPRANGGLNGGWEMVALTLQVAAPVETSAEEQLAQWIVDDLSRENGID